MKRSLSLSLVALALAVVIPATMLARDAGAEVVPLSQALAGQKALRFGDRGWAVAALQLMLTDRGYDPGPVDGIFGPLTQAAVRKAQAGLGLTVDGMAGVATATALEHQGPAVAPTTAPGAESAPADPAASQHDSSPASAATAAETPASVATTDETPAAEGALSPLLDDGPRAPSSTLVVSVAAPAPVPQAAPPAQDAQAAAPAPGAATSSHKAAFALTFNGAPDPSQLPTLLGTLKRYGMHATFFVTGEAAEKQPDLVAALAADGHEVAVSGLTETSMTGLTPAAMQAQLSRTERAVQAATGKDPVFFRPPLGLVTPALADSAAALHLTPVLWTNVGVSDTAEIAPADLAERLLDTVYPGSVLMLHQDRPGTIAAMEPFLGALAARGIHSVTLTELRAGQ